MSDVNFTIGGTPAPFLSAMEQVKESAKESAAKVSESFGIEGVKSERALHTRFMGAFKDITASGTNSAEAIGGAFENMAEGLKLSMGSMIALLAVSELVKTLYGGFEAAEKMKDSVKDALSINTDVTSQSVEQVQDDIKKLNEDAEANSYYTTTQSDARYSRSTAVVVQRNSTGLTAQHIVTTGVGANNVLYLLSNANSTVTFTFDGGTFDGQTVTYHTDNALTSITYSGNVAGVLGDGEDSITAETSLSFMWDGTNSVWFPI